MREPRCHYTDNKIFDFPNFNFLWYDYNVAIKCIVGNNVWKRFGLIEKLVFRRFQFCPYFPKNLKQGSNAIHVLSSPKFDLVIFKIQFSPLKRVVTLNFLCAIGLNHPLKPREEYRIEEKIEKISKIDGARIFWKLLPTNWAPEPLSSVRNFLGYLSWNKKVSDPFEASVRSEDKKTCDPYWARVCSDGKKTCDPNNARVCSDGRKTCDLFMW